MSIYVIRYGDLLKIGYSGQLASRVSHIIRGIPGGTATFVGHMPGDRDVEAHLHSIFETDRFSGEWFRESPKLAAWCDITLIKEMPSVGTERVLGSRRQEYVEAANETKQKLRQYALQRWPEKTHGERELALADALGWRVSRLRGFYHGDARNVLRSTEAEQLRALASLVDRTRASGGDE